MDDSYTWVSLPYTATKDGYMYVKMNSTGNSNWWLYLKRTMPDKSEFVEQFSGTTTYRDGRYIFLKKGDTISLSDSGGSMKFEYRVR